MLIHDALCDYITCGDTSVPAHELKAAIATLKRVDKNTKMTGFQEQFDVRNIGQQVYHGCILSLFECLLHEYAILRPFSL